MAAVESRATETRTALNGRKAGLPPKRNARLKQSRERPASRRCLFGFRWFQSGHRRRLILHRRCDRLGAPHDAKDVSASKLREIPIAPTATDQLGEQVGIILHAVEVR